MIEIIIWNSDIFYKIGELRSKPRHILIEKFDSNIRRMFKSEKKLLE